MPTFIQFNDPGRTVLNLDYLSGLSRGQRTAGEREIAEEKPIFETGQIIYYIRYTVVGDPGMTIKFISKSFRDKCYNDILALIRPVIIGANPSPESRTPTFSTAQPEQGETTAEEYGSTPSEKPLTKPKKKGGK